MNPIVMITGPTAAGKTALALALADRYPIRLINADSAQVYRGLNIGAAKLSPALQSRYPHRLMDIRDPEEDYSVAAFVADADREIETATQQGLWPVLVGGTPLYLQSVLYGLDPLPEKDPEVRRNIARQAQTVGWPELHARLMTIDPMLASRIRPTDAQRIQRALEIHVLTGQPPSELMHGNRIPRYRAFRVVITPADRARLHARIAQRFDDMIDAGFIQEVESLMARAGLTAEHPAMKSVGYRQMWHWLATGEGGFEEVKAQTLAATRQLAKRQLTALRKLSHALWYDPNHRNVADGIGRRVSEFMAKAMGANRASNEIN